MLSASELKRLAELSRLSLTDADISRMEKTIDPVLEYVGRLSKIDTTGVPEVDGNENAPDLREDVAQTSDDSVRRAIISNFPDKAGDALRVPGVFENPKG